MVEMADPDSAAHRFAAEHKEDVTDHLDGLLREVGHRRHREPAEQFMLLVDGANVTALRERTAEPAKRQGDREVAPGLVTSRARVSGEQRAARRAARCSGSAAAVPCRQGRRLRPLA
ncbi:hypothetical protein [Saccharopolyspora pogona]|uniref:hypothetical protein n=1 Tax=Saccharopolyspora pogona TaxID=333966 RepID=UPI0016859428|nr:hypothetical protein [Saccharopolyspora pogona]